ncbi:hypothetical protein Tco_1396811, partial [Tanacetum coccineum]
EQEADKNNDDWISWTIRSLKSNANKFRKLPLRSSREEIISGVGQWLLSVNTDALYHHSGEISAGKYMRAMLQDKDKNPKWAPSKVEFVSDNMVDRYFEAVNDKDWEDLKLPNRPNLTSYAMSKL